MQIDSDCVYVNNSRHYGLCQPFSLSFVILSELHTCVVSELAVFSVVSFPFRMYYVACIVECLNELCAGKKLWPVMCVSSLSCDVTDVRVHSVGKKCSV